MTFCCIITMLEPNYLVVVKQYLYQYSKSEMFVVEIWEFIYLNMIMFQPCIMTMSLFDFLCAGSRSEEEYPPIIHENELLKGFAYGKS
jgi:hypothetical protein